MEVDDFTKAIGVPRTHLPDPKDVKAPLFLRDLYDFLANNRPVLSSVMAALAIIAPFMGDGLI